MRAFIVKFPTSFILLWGVFGLYPFYNPTFAIEYREEAQPKREAIQLPGFNPDIVFNIPKYLEKSLHEDIRFGEVCEIGDSVTTGEQQQQPMRGLASVSASRGEVAHLVLRQFFEIKKLDLRVKRTWIDYTLNLSEVSFGGVSWEKVEEGFYFSYLDNNQFLVTPSDCRPRCVLSLQPYLKRGFLFESVSQHLPKGKEVFLQEFLMKRALSDFDREGEFQAQLIGEDSSIYHIRVRQRLGEYFDFWIDEGGNPIRLRQEQRGGRLVLEFLNAPSNLPNPLQYRLVDQKELQIIKP